MIKSKYINVIIALAVTIALIFSCVLVFIGSKENTNESSEAKSSMEYESKLFDKDQVMDINIEVDESSWQSMLDNAMSEEYILCDVIINGDTFSSVGIRPKGNTSLSSIANNADTDRYSFKIEFDHYISSQNCYGLDKLVLNNIMSDKTYMKEFLSYEIFDYLGVTTPLFSYANIKVNGEEWGLYLAIEAMEESFALRNYGSDYGKLYKPESMDMGGEKGEQDNNTFPQRPDNTANFPNGGMTPPENQQNQEEKNNTPPETFPGDNSDENSKSNINNPMDGGNRGGGFGGSNGGTDLVYKDDEISSYSGIFDNESFSGNKDDYSRVINALKNISTGTDLEKYINIEEVLKHTAANTAIVNLDSYFSNMKHNYYLYEEEGQLSLLPWDYNLSFAGFQSGNAEVAVNFPIDTPVSGVELSERPIIGKLLKIPEYLELYHSYLQELIDGYFNSSTLSSRIDQLNSLINEYVKNDPTAFYTYEEYTNSLEVLKTFVTLRSESIEGQLDGTIPSTEEDQKAQGANLISAEGLNLSDLGTQGGGDKANGGKMPGSNTTPEGNTLPGGNNNQDKTLPRGNAISGNNSSTENSNNQNNSGANQSENNMGNNQGSFSLGNRGQAPNDFSKSETNNSSTSNILSSNNITALLISILILVAGLVFVISFKRKKF